MAAIFDYIRKVYPWLTVGLVFSTVFYSILIAIIFKWLWSKRKTFLLSLSLPGPASFPFIGSVSFIKKIKSSNDQLNAFKEETLKYPSPFRLWLGSSLVVVVTDQNDIESLLRDNHVPLKPTIYYYLSKGIGNGLLTSRGGDSWRKHRLLLNPAFQQLTIKDHRVTVKKHCQKLNDCISSSDLSSTVDLNILFKRFCSDVIVESLLNNDDSCFQDGKVDDVLEAIQVIALLTIERISKCYLHPEFIYSKTDLSNKLNNCNALLQAFFGTIYNKTKVNYWKNKKKALVHHTSNELPPVPINILIEAQNNRGYSEDEIISELINIFASGVESTSNTLGFFILMLAIHKECQDKLYEEVSGFFRNNDDSEGNIQSLEELKYLDQCLKEVLRMFPPNAFLFKQSNEDMHLANKEVSIPRDTLLIIPTYVIHRNEKYWSEPNKFNPDRFASWKSYQQNGIVYLPFSEGPRNCIGQHLGTDIIKITIMQLVKYFEFSTDSTVDDLFLVCDMNIKSATGYRVSITKRNI